jgi:hypothetical protein
MGALRGDLMRYDGVLQYNPSDQDVALEYATSGLPRIIVSRSAELACAALTHWSNYAKSECDFVDRKVIAIVASRLAELQALCPSFALDAGRFSKCH